MSKERDDELLWDIYIYYIDTLAKLLERYVKTNYFSYEFGQVAFCIVGIWNLKAS